MTLLLRGSNGEIDFSVLKFSVEKNSITRVAKNNSSHEYSLHDTPLTSRSRCEVNRGVMEFNVENCIMRVGKNNPSHDYSLNDTPL